MATAKRNRRSKVLSSNKSSRPKAVRLQNPGNLKSRVNSKQEKVLDLLHRPEGASIASSAKQPVGKSIRSAASLLVWCARSSDSRLSPPKAMACASTGSSPESHLSPSAILRLPSLRRPNDGSAIH